MYKTALGLCCDPRPEIVTSVGNLKKNSLNKEEITYGGTLRNLDDNKCLQYRKTKRLPIGGGVSPACKPIFFGYFILRNSLCD